MGVMRCGSYVLGDRLATGGMAEVFSATKQNPLGFRRRVVIKRLLPHLAERPEAVALFLDEARLLARLHHPRVVQVLDLGSEGGAHYQALEYLEGADLGALLSRPEPLPADAAVRLGLAVAEALAYVHAARDEAGQPLGIVHCDLAPGNVMVTRTGEVKLIDFGVARWAGRPGGTPPAGTRGYLAPEVLAGGPVDARADLYGLGQLLRRLFQGLEQPPALAALCEALCAQEPAARPRSAEEALAVLNACLRELGGGRPLAASLKARFGPERRRRAEAGLGTQLLTAPAKALHAAVGLGVQVGAQVVAAPQQLVAYAQRWARPRMFVTSLIAGSALGALGLGVGLHYGERHREAPRARAAAEAAPAVRAEALPLTGPAPLRRPMRKADLSELRRAALRRRGR